MWLFVKLIPNLTSGLGVKQFCDQMAEEFGAGPNGADPGSALAHPGAGLFGVEPRGQI